MADRARVMCNYCAIRVGARPEASVRTEASTFEATRSRSRPWPEYSLRMRTRRIDPREHTTYSSLKEFMDADEYPSGVLTVMRRGIPIDIKYEPRGFDTTTVFFHAALTGKKYTYPVFTGAGVSAELPTNRIFIADPSLYLSDELFLGWYAGNHKQPRLQYVIRGILNHLVPAGQKMVTFGSSGGGFAALYYAAHRDNSVAVPVNPQTNLANYNRAAVERYARLAWGLSGGQALKKIPAVTDLTRTYRAPGKKAFYVQNTNDRTHMQGHYSPFMDALPAGHDVRPVLVEGKAGHHPPPKTVIREVLATAVDGAPLESDTGTTAGLAL